MLTRLCVCVCVCVWQELEYRIAVCRVTRDARIGHLLLLLQQQQQQSLFSCGCEQFH